MSIRFNFAGLPHTQDHAGDRTASSSSDSEDCTEEDDNFEDWVSDHEQLKPCPSLFEDKTFTTATEALTYDKTTHGFDLDATSKQWSASCLPACLSLLKPTGINLELDLHRRIRLINFIRKHKLTPADVGNLTDTESFFTSDDYLIPVIEDDPYCVKLDFDDDWSDDDEDGPSTELNPGPPSDLPTALRRIQILEKKLSQAQMNLSDYRKLVTQNLDISSLAEIINDPDPSTGEAPRDDDTHYFLSYEYNDIHAVMIQDKVRTSSYASFILTNPILFRDAIVLDVGCGTGVLSLFAAKSGAKHVYAVDASGIAEKAEKIVRENGLQDVVTVIRGKVEEIRLPDGVDHVDIIISEWMGYALLYESMLDSVLLARDRFLRPNGGVMAPSQCRMMLALCEGNEIVKDRVEFWDDIYGFDLSEMAQSIYEDAILDVVSPESVVSEPYLLKDLHLQTTTSRQLEFTSPFSLTSTSPMRTKIHALVLYFDTFFTTTGAHLSPDVPVRIIKDGDVTLAEVWPIAGKPPPKRRASLSPGLKEREEKRVISFSTGPTSQPTHWMQTLFLLKDPILAEEGTVVSGTFYCKKSDFNSRELEVEIHYSVRKSADAAASEVIVQMYKVH
ncbi:S-adenosyl-L-methionine-dependent methyltransferase [Boletus reticuloceps]|uniref:type I protein arginine methyltransferase n=1 Tax=Boletus reticuloceps TaxID=495285 RepID=A0A8I3ABP3_9AGAM|nr:S-adenosyl-L-methionine-dependent methyltransferase [Boletus reticuloceps]